MIVADRKISRIFKLTPLLAFCVLISGTCENHERNGDFRIVSLSPAMTEMIFALGSGADLVGVTTYCDYPEAARVIKKIGDFSNPSIERIVSLEPSLVIVNLPEQKRIKEVLEKLKIPVFVSSPRSLTDIYHEISAMGIVLNKKSNADSLIQYMAGKLKQKPPCGKKIYVELSPKPLVTIGSASFLNEIIARAGGVNIFSDLDRDYPMVSQEEVIRRNPEIIIVLHPGRIEDRVGWGKISAIRKKKVYRDLNPDVFMRPGPRLILGYEELEKILE